MIAKNLKPTHKVLQTVIWMIQARRCGGFFFEISDGDLIKLVKKSANNSKSKNLRHEPPRNYI